MKKQKAEKTNVMRIIEQHKLPYQSKKQFHTTIHHTAAEYETIMFSGGKIGCQIEMSLADLQKIVPVATVDIL